MERWLCQSGTLALSERNIHIGYLAEKPFLYDFFNPFEMLLYDNTMRCLDLSSDAILESCIEIGLENVLGKKIHSLSQGTRKRISLISAFMGKPLFVVLDEPLNGLDISTVIKLKSMIENAQSRGCCVLISSHILDFFTNVVSRVLFIDGGKLVEEVFTGKEDLDAIYRRLFVVDTSSTLKLDRGKYASA